MIFSSSPDSFRNFTAGQALGVAINIDNTRLNDFRLITHELIHVNQWSNFSFANSYFQKSLDPWRKDSKVFRGIDKYVHWEFNSIILGGLYQIEEINSDCFINNFFEREAEYFSLRTTPCQN